MPSRMPGAWLLIPSLSVSTGSGAHQTPEIHVQVSCRSTAANAAQKHRPQNSVCQRARSQLPVPMHAWDFSLVPLCVTQGSLFACAPDFGLEPIWQLGFVHPVGSCPVAAPRQIPCGRFTLAGGAANRTLLSSVALITYPLGFVLPCGLPPGKTAGASPVPTHACGGCTVKTREKRSRGSGRPEGRGSKKGKAHRKNTDSFFLRIVFVDESVTHPPTHPPTHRAYTPPSEH